MKFNGLWISSVDSQKKGKMGCGKMHFPHQNVEESIGRYP